jgi:hypothetical protein
MDSITGARLRLILVRGILMNGFIVNTLISSHIVYKRETGQDHSGFYLHLGIRESILLFTGILFVVGVKFLR